MNSSVYDDRSIALELRAPPGDVPAWLDEIRAFRGRELYAGGRRPAFKVGEDRYLDADERDVHAYHVTTRDVETGELLGCFRFMPLDGSPPSQVDAVLGLEMAERALAEIGAERQRMMESARWIVRRDQQGRGVGYLLMASGFAFSQLLGYDGFWAIAGIRDGQAARCQRAGYRPIPGTTVLSSELFADELCPLYAIAARPSSRLAPLVEGLLRDASPLVAALGGRAPRAA